MDEVNGPETGGGGGGDMQRSGRKRSSVWLNQESAAQNGRDINFHRNVEKTRRDRMNFSLKELCSKISENFFKQGLSGRVDKIQIVDVAISYIDHLEKKIDELNRSQAERMTTTSSHLDDHEKSVWYSRGLFEGSLQIMAYLSSQKLLLSPLPPSSSHANDKCLTNLTSRVKNIKEVVNGFIQFIDNFCQDMPRAKFDEVTKFVRKTVSTLMKDHELEFKFCHSMFALLEKNRQRKEVDCLKPARLSGLITDSSDETLLEGEENDARWSMEHETINHHQHQIYNQNSSFQPSQTKPQIHQIESGVPFSQQHLAANTTSTSSINTASLCRQCYPQQPYEPYIQHLHSQEASDGVDSRWSNDQSSETSSRSSDPFMTPVQAINHRDPPPKKIKSNLIKRFDLEKLAAIEPKTQITSSRSAFSQFTRITPYTSGNNSIIESFPKAFSPFPRFQQASSSVTNWSSSLSNNSKNKTIDQRWMILRQRSDQVHTNVSSPSSSSLTIPSTKSSVDENRCRVPEPNLLSVFIMHSSKDYYISGSMDQSLVDEHVLVNVINNLDYRPRHFQKVYLDVALAPALTIVSNKPPIDKQYDRSQQQCNQINQAICCSNGNGRKSSKENEIVDSTSLTANKSISKLFKIYKAYFNNRLSCKAYKSRKETKTNNEFLINYLSKVKTNYEKPSTEQFKNYSKG